MGLPSDDATAPAPSAGVCVLILYHIRFSGVV